MFLLRILFAGEICWGGLPLPSPMHESESEVAQLYPTICDPMDCSTPGFPVYHQLPELAQTHVH